MLDGIVPDPIVQSVLQDANPIQVEDDFVRAFGQPIGLRGIWGSAWRINLLTVQGIERVGELRSVVSMDRFECMYSSI